MSIDPRITAYRNTPNKSYRQNVPRRGVVLHHGALTSFDYLRRLAMGEKQVSATNIVKDLQNENLMSDEFRAWSLSSAWADSSFRTVETCNESTNGWTISDASHWTLARMVAYWAERDGFWPHRDGDPKTWTVLGHREVYTIWNESYGTACPGGMDLDLVTRRAQQILASGGSTAGLGSTEIPRQTEEDMFPMKWRNHCFTFGKQYVKHEVSYEAAVFVRNVVTAADEFIELDDGAMTAVCESFGIPWYGVDQAMRGIAPGQGGKVWSRELEIIRILRNEIPDTAELRSTIEDVIRAAGEVTPAG